MILLNNVVEIFALPDLDLRLVLGIISLDGRRVRPAFIDSNDARNTVTFDGPSKKPQGGLAVALRGCEEIDRLALLIDGTIKVTMLACDLDVGLI